LEKTLGQETFRDLVLRRFVRGRSMPWADGLGMGVEGYRTGSDLTFLAGIFNLIFGAFLKWWANRGPAPIVVESEKAGAATQAATTDAATVKTVEAEAQAEANAPKSQADTVAALEKGTF
jgi:hypothetical protein